MAGKIEIKEKYNRKNAGHIRHVVVCNHDVSERKYVGKALFLFDYVVDSEYHKRKNSHGVEPHNVPVVSYKVAAERV